MANKKIEVFLRGYHLGTLSYDREKDVYTYNSDLKEEEKFKARFYYQLEDYNLWGSENVKSGRIPAVFGADVANIKIRSDILKHLNLPEKPADFDYLYALGKYKQCDNFMIYKSVKEQKNWEISQW